MEHPVVRRKRAIPVLVAAIAIAIVTSCTSQEAGSSTFPSEQITLVVAGAPGGGTDAIARKLAPLASEKLGVDVQVVNRPSGSSVPGMKEVLEDDSGHTVILQGPLIAGLRPNKIADLGPDDFAALMIPQVDSMAIAVNSDSEWDTIEEFKNAAADNPGRMKIATCASGCVYHAAVSLIKREGLNVTVAPFAEGSAPAVTALLGNRVDAIGNSPAELRQYVKSGKMTMLAVGADERLEDFPDVPTFEEAGFSEEAASVKAFRALLGNPGADEEHLAKLEDVFLSVAKSEEFVKYLEENSYERLTMNGDEATKYLKEQAKLYEKIYGS